MKLKRRITIFSLGNRIAILLLLIFLCTLIILNSLKIQITNILKEYAVNEVTNISTYIINEAVSNSKLSSIENSDLIIMTKNNKEEIISIDFNTLEVNRYLVSINNSILEKYKYMQLSNYSALNNSIIKQDNNLSKFVYYIPLGIVNKNPVLSNLGPKIPIKAEIIGNIRSNIKTELTPYGINNSLLKIYIEVTTNINFIMPFVTDKVVVKEEIPVIIKLINGSIPNVYGSGYAVNSPFSES